MCSGTELMSRTTSAGDISSSSSIPPEYVAFWEMAQVQVACDKCGRELVPNAAYCERCGERTRRARRLVRVAARGEILFFRVVVPLVFGFTWIYSQQH